MAFGLLSLDTDDAGYLRYVFNYTSVLSLVLGLGLCLDLQPDGEKAHCRAEAAIASWPGRTLTMETLEWATLLVCCTALLLRLPDVVRGRNRTVFGILLLGTLCSVLAVSELYDAIDGRLGGQDVTSLILRYLVFAVVLLVGLRVTTALDAAGAHRLISGANRTLGLGPQFPGRDGDVLPDGRHRAAGRAASALGGRPRER